MADLVTIGFKADAKGIEEVNKGFGKVVTSGGRADKVLKDTEKSVTKFSGAAAKTGNKMSMLGRQSGQAGIQLQQFIGQVQGGQSAMLALSQQSADLGFVLGAPLLGAVVGISASIAGMLLPNIFKTTNAVSDLEKISKDLGVTLTKSSDGAVLLSDKIEKLAKRSNALAKLQISTSIRDAEKAIKIASTGISDALDGAFGMTTEHQLRSFSTAIEEAAIKTNRSVDDVIKILSKGKNASISFSKEIGVSDALTTISRQFGLTKIQAGEFGVAVSKVFNDASIINIKKLENTITDLNTSTGGSNENMLKLAKSLLPLFSAVTDGVDDVNLLRQAFGDLKSALDTSSESGGKNKSAIDEISKSLGIQTIALRDGEEAALKYEIAQRLGLAITDKKLAPLQKEISAYFSLVESKKEAAKAEALLKSEQAKSSAEQAKQEQSLQQLSLGLAEQIIQLQMTSDEYEIYNAKMTAIANGATPEMVTAIENQVKTIQKLRAELKGDGDVELGGNLDSLISQVDNFGNSWSNTGDTIARAMGDIVGGLDAYSSKMEKITGLEQSLRTERELSTATSADKLRIDKALADLSDQSTRAQLSGMAQISGAASSLFAEQSKEREALHKMEQVYTAIEIGLALQKAGANALTAITASFAAPFPLNFAAGAAMIGIMAGLGVFSGSGGGSAPTSAELQATQGTGTTLGDSEAKSESIVNALEEYNDIGIDQLSELVAIRNAMSNLASGIESLAVSLVTSSSFGGGNVDLKDSNFLDTKTGSFFRKIDPVARTLDLIGLGGIADSIFAGFSSTKQKLLDTGLQFGEQTLSDLLADGIQGTYYNVIQTTKRKLWGLSKKVTEKTEFSDVEDSILSEFTSIFAFIGDTVNESLDSLGVDAAGTFKDLEIDLGSLSFKDLSGEEIQAELEAIFSQQGDLIAEYMLPQITQFQEMGEGALEALTRVAKEQVYFNDAIDNMGLSLGELSNLMRIEVAQSILDLMGGLEAFSEATNSYIDNFFSDSEKMEMLGSSLSDVFTGLSIPMVDTTDGFRDLVASIDLTTLAGQEMFAALMAISPALAEYIEMLDDQEEAIKELARDAYDALVLAVEAEKERVAAVLEGAQEIYAAEIERITGVRDALTETFDTLTSNLDDAKSAITNSFDAQKQQIIDASALRVEAIQQEIDASTTYHNIELDFLSERKSALNDMISGLSGASSNLRSVVDVDTNALSTDLANALSQAQRGNFNPAIALGDISSLMGDASQFSSAAQMNVSRGVTGFAANELANLVDNQLSVEERTLALLEQQTIDETARYDAEQAMLAERIEKENDYADAQTAALDAQLNNLLGINTGVLSVDASIIAFKKAQDELNSLDYERQLEMLAEQEEWAMEALDVAEQNSQDQIDKLDDILNNATAQINALYNINTSVLSVQEAIFQLQTTIANAEAAQATRDAQIAKQTRKTADGIQQINAVGVQTEAIA